MTSRPGIMADVLVIWGRLDGIAPLAHGEALRAALPNAKMDVIDRWKPSTAC